MTVECSDNCEEPWIRFGCFWLGNDVSEYTDAPVRLVYGSRSADSKKVDLVGEEDLLGVLLSQVR